MSSNAHFERFRTCEPVHNDEYALDAMRNKDVIGVLIRMSSKDRLRYVIDNIAHMRHFDIYEEALLTAFCDTPVNNRWMSLEFLCWLFEVADREKLLAAGLPLPDGDTFTVYRGVSGVGRARRVRSLSWTLDRGQAEWFARRFEFIGNPGVYEATISRDEVMAYVTTRSEEEIICLPSKYRKVPMLGLNPAHFNSNTAVAS